MNESEYQALVEVGWRRPLTSEEQARIDLWLAAQPQSQGDLESDAALTQLLQKLPDAPVASNFTAQVLRALEREGAAESRAKTPFARFGQWLRRPATRLAWAVLLVGTVWFGYQQHQETVREDVTRGFAVLAKVAALSDPTVLQDFDAIQRLGQTAPGEDEELFAVLNQ
jgi:hypothetical protein